jgi:hypothetical protein
MRDMMAQIRDVGDGIRGGTYTMTAPIITGGSVTGSTINNSAIGGTTAAAGAFTTLGATGVATFSAGTVSAPAITASGDTNTGIFFPAADTIAFTEGGVESMRIDSSGNVGIGVTPSAWSGKTALQISTGGGAVTGSSDRLELWFNSYFNGSNVVRTNAGYAGLYNYINSNGAFVWSVAGTSTAGSTVSFSEAMRITDAGNVGIGTSSPSTKLDVVGAVDDGFVIRSKNTNVTSVASARLVSENDNGTFAQVTTYSSAFGFSVFGTTAANFSSVVTSGANSNGLMVGTLTSDPIIVGTNDTERMRITSAGNVGIGTSSPQAKLHVSNSSSGLLFSEDGSKAVIIGTNAAGTVSQELFLRGDPLTFTGSGGGGAEHMRLNSDGQLLVGTTSGTTLSSVAWRTTLTGTGNNFAVLNTDTGGATTSAFQASNYTGSGSAIINFYNGSGGVAGTISVPTNASTGTTVSYNTSSDYRMKENIAPMTGALVKVASLKPVTYTWKANGYAGQGFIAHELQAVVPECVSGEKDAVDKNGKPVYQGIDTSFLVATLTAAIQEQQALIENLTTRLNALEGK